MNPRTFVPVLFIDIGEKNCFFTLRETYLRVIHTPGDGPAGNAVVNGVYQGSVSYEESSFHHYNLATEAEEAFTKATADAERLGLRLVTTLDEIRFKLADIQRATAAELAAREERYRQMREEHEAERAEKAAKRLSDLEAGVCSFGKYTGKKFEDIPRSYLAWVVEKTADFEPDSLMRVLGTVVAAKFSHLLPPTLKLDAFLGEEGERVTVDVEVVRVFSFERQQFAAHWLTETIWIVTMATPDGVCLVAKGTSFCPRDGEKLRIKATVKAHEFYGSQAQTTVQRVVVLDPSAPVKKTKKAAPAAATETHQEC